MLASLVTSTSHTAPHVELRPFRDRFKADSPAEVSL